QQMRIEMMPGQLTASNQKQYRQSQKAYGSRTIKWQYRRRMRRFSYTNLSHNFRFLLNVTPYPVPFPRPNQQFHIPRSHFVHMGGVRPVPERLVRGCVAKPARRLSVLAPTSTLGEKEYCFPDE